MNLLTDALKTAASQTEAESADDAAAIGRAARKKERRESADSLAAALASHRDNGRAKVWRRRITVATNAETESGRETREVAVFERADAYSERTFLRLCNSAAAAAVNGGWSRPDAVESVGAELCVRVLAKTAGRMPKRGSLGRTLGDSENPDAAYLTGMARRVVAEALRGDKGKAGLAAEAFPVAAADGAADFDLKAAAAESVEKAEAAPDPYLVDGTGDFLTEETRGAVKRLAIEAGHRPKSVAAAICAALRPSLRAADWADADYAKTAGAFRKAAHTGRAAIAPHLRFLTTGPREWSDADWRDYEAAAPLLAADAIERETRHIGEVAEIAPHHGVSLDWPMRKVPAAPWRVISADSLATYPGRG